MVAPGRDRRLRRVDGQVARRPRRGRSPRRPSGTGARSEARGGSGCSRTCRSCGCGGRRPTRAEEYADAAFGAFAAGVDPHGSRGCPSPSLVLPYGNTEAPDGRASAHGLTGLFRPDAESDASPASRLSGRPGAGWRSRRSRPRAAAARTSARTRPGGGAGSEAGAPPPAPTGPTHLTSAGLEGLQAELEQLTTVEAPRGGRADQGGARAGRPPGERRLRGGAAGAVVPRGPRRPDRAMLRSVVVIDDVERAHIGSASGRRCSSSTRASRRSTRSSGRAEAKPSERRISDTSPLGRALVGSIAGDDVVVKAPSGERHYRVLVVS